MNIYYNKRYFEERDILIPHLATAIKSLAKKHKLKTVLDVGCGTGRLVNYLNKERIFAYGCDISNEAVKKAIVLNSKRSIYLASADKLPFKNGSFDLVTSISTIEHLDKKSVKKFIEEAGRVLKTKGFIFLVTPNFSSPFRSIYGKNWFGYKDPTHINFFTPNALSNLLKANGFDHINFNFKIPYQNYLEWDFPSFFHKFPKWLKILVIYLLFSTPLSRIRNSFWISAQKVSDR